MKVSKLAVRLDVPPSDGGLNVPMRLTRGDVHIIFKLRAWPVSDIGNECLHMPTHQHAVTDGCAQDIHRRASLGTVPQESSHLAGHCIARKEVQVWHVQVDRLHLWGPAHARNRCNLQSQPHPFWHTRVHAEALHIPGQSEFAHLKEGVLY